MKIIVCGDIALWRGVELTILKGNKKELDPDIRNILGQPDIFLANIECPLTDSEYPAWNYRLTLKGSREVGSFLGAIGVNVASLANNHIADYGKQGLEDTIAVLEEQGISWVGAGWSPEEARRPLIIERDGLKLGILALAQPEISASTRLGWGAGVLEDEYARNRMASLSKEVDIAIAYLHYGVEFSEYPTPHQVRLSRGLVDAGAKLVIGHHPHVPQGYEWYKGGFIAYSLGNFIFDFAGGPHKFSRLGLLLHVDIEKNVLNKIEMILIDSQKGNPILLQGAQRDEALNYLSRISFAVQNSNELIKQYYFICRNNLKIHLDALLYYGIRKRNIGRIKDWFSTQFWPQIFELRKDLFWFLLAGDALRLEKRKGGPSEGFAAHLWRGICFLFWLMGVNWLKFTKKINK
jgi:hypothetical protein